MHPLLLKRRNPRVGGENGDGAGAPGAITFTAGSGTLLSLKPLAIVMVHSPCCGSVKAAVYWPRPAAGTTLALDVSSVAEVARIVRRNSGRKGNPCLPAGNVWFNRFPANAHFRQSTLLNLCLAF